MRELSYCVYLHGAVLLAGTVHCPASKDLHCSGEKEMINFIVTRLRAEAEVICLKFVEGRRRLTSLLGGGQGIQVALERLGVSFRGIEAVAKPAFKSYTTSNANANVTQGPWSGWAYVRRVELWVQ